MSGPAALPRAFFERPTTSVARDLLGKILVRRVPAAGAPILARIVEVEAYLGERDAASHARRGPTPRSAIMFGPPGFLYVYLIYGMHHCMNFVTESDGQAGAVLIRAGEPLGPGEPPVPGEPPGPGEPPVQRPLAAGKRDARPFSGPGKLCSGLGITLADKGLDLTAGGALYVADGGGRAPRRAASPRIGVDYAGSWAARKLRFYIPGNSYVSGQPRI